jgi:hypothetical protein
MNEEFWQEVESLIKPVVTPKIEYRLYYNQLGEITMGTMTTDTLPTDPYVIVTKEEYDTYFNYCVVNEQLVKIDRASVYSVKLRKSDKGFATVAGHAGLVVESNETYQDIEYYEYRNN